MISDDIYRKEFKSHNTLTDLDMPSSQDNKMKLNPGSAMTGPVRSWRVALTNQDRTGLVNGRH